jgi:Arc/MetJ-type ribon-helix-helix transcriptional regulator
MTKPDMRMNNTNNNRPPNGKMKVVTCNIPMKYIDTIESLINDYGLYNSRSEIIRESLLLFFAQIDRVNNNINTILIEKDQIVIDNKIYRIRPTKEIKNIHHPELHIPLEYYNHKK